MEQLNIFDTYYEDEEDSIFEVKNLTLRQKKTYNLIQRNTAFGKTTSQKDIVCNYPNTWYKDGYVWNSNPKVHDHCSVIWQDINVINSNWEVDKIIIWDDNYNYKLAESPTEVENFCKKLYWEKAMAKLWRYGNLMRKVKRDGQCKEIFMTENEARAYWETFLQTKVDDLVKKSMEDF